MSYPRYSQYKDSGVEWLGIVPAHWDLKRLKRISRLVTGKSHLEHTRTVALENIESWTGRLIESETTFESDGTSFECGDILFGKLRPYLAKVWVADGPGQAVGDFHIVRAYSGIDRKYLQLLMLDRSFISVVDGSTIGAKMPRASWETLGSMTLPVPPADEQQAIVTFAEREIGRLDDLVVEQTRAIGLLHEKRQAVISHVVTKGLHPAVAMKSSGVDWLGEIPRHWQIANLGMMSKRIVVGIAEAATHAYAAHGVPILRSTNIRPNSIVGDILFITPEFAAQRDSKRIRGGDLVTARTGNAGVTAVVPEHFDGCQCFTMLVTTVADELDAQFACYWLNSDFGRWYFATEGWGTAQANISVPILKSVPLPLPPRDEQVEIASAISQNCESIDSLIHEAERSMELLKERRSALISGVVTGKIDVRAVDISR